MTDPEPASDTILDPIPGDTETGVFVRYLGDYTRIEEARRVDDPNAPRGVWQRSLKQADWADVVELCRDVLRSRSKDLQIAAWMVEAMCHRDGLAAIGPGLDLISDLCKRYWDGLYPEIEENGDAAARAASISWLDDKLSVAVLSSPLVGPPEAVDEAEYTWTDYRQARHLEGLKSRDPGALKRAEAAGTVTMAVFREAVGASKTDFYVALQRDLESAAAAAERLEALFDDKLGDDAPGMTRLRRSIEDVLAFMQPIVAARLPPEPAPGAAPEAAKAKPPEPAMDETSAPTSTDVSAAATAGAAPTAGAVEPPSQPTAAAIPAVVPAAAPATAPEGVLRTADDAHEALLRIAAFLTTVDPHSPSPYLVEKAVRWGRMPFHEVLRDVVDQGYDFTGLMYLLGVPSGRD
jgi:type VI secretion system protein ImpA